MQLLVFLLVAGVIIAVARALMPVMILAVITSLLWTLIQRPLELIGLVTLLLMAEALSLQPVATILCVAFVISLVVIRKPTSQSDDRP